MRQRIMLLFAVCLLATTAFSQTFLLQDYLKARKQYGIGVTSSSQSLASAPNDSVLEISGVIKGSASGGGNGITIMVDAGDNQLLLVQSSEMPEWMKQDNAPARMLIDVSRKDDIQTPNYMMLKAVPEPLMRVWERDHPNRPGASGYGTARSGPANRSRGSYTRPGTQISSRGDINRSWYTKDEAFPLYANFIAAVNPRLSENEVNVITDSILKYSIKYNVDARLIVAMVIAESGFNPNATSRVGARGLGQLMPGTARGMGVSNAYDPEQNIEAAIKIIGSHMQSYGGSSQVMSLEQIRLTMAAYNAGSGAVKRYGGVPPYRETQNYVRRVISLYQQLCQGH